MTFYILIPVYNMERWLPGCLASVFAQTRQNFRVILVDDGSPDGSGALCDSYAAQDSRITVIHQKNTGPYGARRAAITACLRDCAEDDWAIFLDADDTLKPNALETIEKTFLREMCDLVVIGEDQVWQDTILRPFPVAAAYTGTVTDKAQLYRIVFRDGWYNPLWKKAVSVSLLPPEGVQAYYPVRFGEDLLQSIPLYRDCRKAVFLPDSLYNYTINPQSATNALNYEKYQCNSLVLRECWDFLKSQQVWSEEDFTAYLAWLRRLTRFQVSLVAKFASGISNRAALLRQIHEDTFYAMVIDTAPGKDILLRLMQRRHYRLICVGGTIVRHLGAVRRKVRRR